MILESNKLHGLAYALAPNGWELPVVDVTHPAFTDSTDLAASFERFRRETERSARMPAWFVRWMMRFFLKRAVLGRALMEAEKGHLSGMGTYLFKLGPSLMGSWATPLDRKIAGSPPAVNLRLRLAHTARLLADSLAAPLYQRPGADLRFVNIAGGPASDSFNTLILLRKEHPEWLYGRAISIVVLDLDEEGPAFGAAALAALGSAGGPLAGLQIRFDRVPYDWRAPGGLAALLGGFPRDAVVAGSSEGGLFEYGTDEDVAANLRAFAAAAPAGAVMAGSGTPEHGPVQDPGRASRVPLIRRDFARFAALAAGCGWGVSASHESPFSYQFCLARA